jgi:DUF4097 and DUF4098 domain-containing protein YvlB
MKVHLVAVLMLLLCFSVNLAAEEVEKTETKRFRFSSDGEISLLADDGSVTVKTWNRNEVVVKMTKRAWGRNRKEAQKMLDDIRIRFQDHRDRLVIRELPSREEEHFNLFDLFDGEFWREKRWRKATVDFELTVPQSASMKLQSDEGDVEIFDTEGDIVVDVDEGNVEIESIRSDEVQIFVDEGHVSIRDWESGKSGRLKIDADEGDIFIGSSRFEEANIGSDEGEIVLRNVALRRCWLVSDEGDIEADTAPMENCNYRIETDEGRISITLPSEVQVLMRLVAEEGRIDSDFDMDIEDYDDGERSEGVIGSREGVMRVYTEEGDIDVYKR